jgi:hypothetical protein
MAKNQMDKNQVQSLVAHYISAGEHFDKTELAQKRQRAIEYYNGEMLDTPSKPNRSKVVSHDVADTIGWIMPSVMRVFTATDEIVAYEPEREEDEAGAKQASDYICWSFWKENDGYNVIYDSAHDAMLANVGVVKHYWDDTPETRVSNHSGLTDIALTQLLQEGNVKVLTQDTKESEATDPVTGETMPLTLYDVKIERELNNGKLVIEIVPPEDFLVDGSVDNLDDMRFCAQRCEKTRSELVQMGFKKSEVDKLPSITPEHKEEDNARTDEVLANSENGVDRSTDLVEIYECYVKADADGDGVAELLKVVASGSGNNCRVIDWEVWDDDLPFTDIKIDRVPHRWEGRSIADETVDIQQIKTVIMRQALDNLYAVNNPQKEVEEGTVANPDQLVSPSFGGIIWRRKGQTPINPHVVPYIGDKAFMALEYMDSVNEKRTGVSKSTAAMDPSALQNQTAEAVREQKDGSHSKIELITRNLADGYRRMFRKILKIIIKHQDIPRQVRLNNEWVQVDPRHWNAGMDVTVNTGLGTGSRDRDMQMLNMILQNQYGIAGKFAEMGMGGTALDMLPLIRNTLAKLSESAGLKSPEMFFPEVGKEEVAKLKQQAGGQKDGKAEAEKAKLMASQQEAQAKMQMEAQKAQMDVQLQNKKLEAEMAMKREQLSAEMQLKREQLEAEIMLKREANMMGAAAANGNISDVHMGGEPG